MAIKSVYWPGLETRDNMVRVTGDEHRHLRVSRTVPGERVELFDGAGRVLTGEMVEGSRAETRFRILDERRVPAPETELAWGQGLIRNAVFERVLEKAVEIGVTRIIPFLAHRSNDRGQGRAARWKKIIVEASKQSKRYHLPRLDPVTDFEGVIRSDARSKIIFTEGREGQLDSAVQGAPVLYLIGPEGGWTDDEVEAASAAGFRSVRLGSHILRAETAAIVAPALIARQLGTL